MSGDQGTIQWYQDLVHYFQHIPTLVICWSIICFVKQLKWVTITKQITELYSGSKPQIGTQGQAQTSGNLLTECPYALPNCSPRATRILPTKIQYKLCQGRQDKVKFLTYLSENYQVGVSSVYSIDMRHNQLPLLNPRCFTWPAKKAEYQASFDSTSCLLTPFITKD